MNNLTKTLAALAASHERSKNLKNRRDTLINARFDGSLSLSERIEKSKQPEEIARRDELEKEICSVDTELMRENVKGAILKNNSYVDLMRDVWPHISAILNKYTGKKYGPKTNEKMANELKNVCGCRFHIRHTGYSDYIDVIYMRDGHLPLDIDIRYKYSDNGNLAPMLIDNIIQAPEPIENIYVTDVNNKYFSDIEKATDEIITAYEAVKTAAEKYEAARKAYDVLHVNGLNEVEYLRQPYRSIV